MEMDLEGKEASPELRGLFLRFIKLKEDFKELGDAGDEAAAHMYEKIDTIFKGK